MATKTTNTAAIAAIATVKGTAFTSEKAVVENPSKTQTLTPSNPSTPASGSESPVLSNLKSHPASGDAENGADAKAKETEAPSNDIERKMRRAERFGVPVQLSEQDKRNSRAERFGTVSVSDEAKSSEDLKRKARADRFGMSAKSSADEDAKKKSRLARFGSDVKVDTQEEEKRKARALRFAKDPVSANGKQNAEMETAAVAGNTAGGT